MGIGCADPPSASAFTDGMEQLAATVEAAIAGEHEGFARLSAGLRAALDFLAAKPAVAELLLVDSLRAGFRGRPEYERALERLAAVLHAAQAAVPGTPTLGPENALMLAGGIVSHLGGRVLGGEVERLPESQELLLRFVLGPRDSD